ncbi:MAG: SDR family NAD(P)-dependent oxidoreductase [Planctomycetota bacterium]|nr:SDR family NAD(P)-dependent oxidoreductase [Planctomycetota bacterium]
MAETDIAIVGMAGRLPGGPGLREFWRMLDQAGCASVELSEEALRASGLSEVELADETWVKRAMVLPDIDCFDAPFFSMSARDAAIMDPQHRLFLEVCWQAFENAGHVPARFDGQIGVFAGCGMDTYLLNNVLSNPALVRDVGMFLIRHTGNDKDFLATRVSYEFDLRGPSVNVLTACSSSLVAVHQAQQSLLNGESDMALAGGVTIQVPQDLGYRYQPGEVLSPDGYCRTFDAKAQGTVFGNGAGVVLLRRLEDALADGDRILGVIAGSAVNNDGARKVSYLAPSVDGYAEVVAEALALAGESAERVQYVEAHGTATPVGDPIEIEALGQAFRVTTDRRQYCAIGSVKSNIGHLDAAAGVAGLLKVVLAMQAGRIPQSLHFEEPNPQIDFAASPFRVAAQGEEWPVHADGTRVAGVSSLGVGGTNAHVIVKQPELPARAQQPYGHRYHLMLASAKTGPALTRGVAELATHLESAEATDLPAIGYTTQVGREGFRRRVYAVGDDSASLCQELRDEGLPGRIVETDTGRKSVVFLFPGGGAQYPGMGRELYEHNATYQKFADECLAALSDKVASELRELLFGGRSGAEHSELLQRPRLALPALFLTEYALARTLMELGVEPDAMLGHSMGEYVAACLAGAFTAAQGMKIVSLRGELFEEVAAGAMLSVSLQSEEVGELAELQSGELSVAAANAPGLCAVAGSVDAVDRLQRQLEKQGVDNQRLHIGVAAHSHLLDPVLDRFRSGLEGLSLQPANRPFVSNVTGDWIDPERAGDPDYWVEHLRHTVRFHEGVSTVLDQGDRVFVEVGPGLVLTSLVRMHGGSSGSALVLGMPGVRQDDLPADCALFHCLGQLWQAGVEPNWQALHGGIRQRQELPTYSFERERHWIEPGAAAAGLTAGSDTGPMSRRRLQDWLECIEFTAEPLDKDQPVVSDRKWLVIGDAGGVAEDLRVAIAGGGGHAFVPTAAAEFRATETGAEFDPEDAASVEKMVAAACAGELPQCVVMLLPADNLAAESLVVAMLHIQQALGKAAADDGLRMLVVTVSALGVAGRAAPANPEQAVAHGFARVAATEYQQMHVRGIDLDPAESPGAMTANALLLEIDVPADSWQSVSVRRDGVRMVSRLATVTRPDATPIASVGGGVTLITGGLGGIGLSLAEQLARIPGARLALVSRGGLPPREVWDEWLQRRGADRLGSVMERIRGIETSAEVEVFAADCSDPVEMERVLARVRARFGGLDTVFHAAGVLDDGLIQQRSAAQVRDMLRAKVQGARVLDQQLAEYPPALMVLFASTSGLIGIPGQCDYAAGNAYLDSFAAWRTANRPGRTVAIDWGMWQGSGMLAQADRLELGFASGNSSAFLGQRRSTDSGTEFFAPWSADTRWQLAEHRVDAGRFVMPGTAYLELMTTAVREVTSHPGEIELFQCELPQPLILADGASVVLFVVVESRGEQLALRVESAADQDGDRMVHAQAYARAGSGVAQLQHLDVWWHEAYRAAVTGSGAQQHIEFGPRWECVKRVGFGDGLGVAELVLSEEYRGDLQQHDLHPAILDMAFGFGIGLCERAEGELLAPIGCDSVRIAAALPAEVVARVQVRGASTGQLVSMDLELASTEGVPLVVLEGLTLVRLQGGFQPDAVKPSAVTSMAQRAAVGAPAAPPRLAALLPGAIGPAEGLQAIADAVVIGQSQVVVSSYDSAKVADWLGRPQTPERRSGAAVAASASAMPPRDDLEREIAGAYGDLLGIDGIGIDEDFFELGGHSLLAVRLFARLHSNFGVDLELATLLRAGSVRALASVMRQHLGQVDPSTETVPSVAAHSGDHVVPIQTNGTRPNLFFVHGAGGNVLGFRDVSHYLGNDQPFYGLQARGVDGRSAPHDSIVEMARDYLEEVRDVQPSGPYYLGGYSGGGCVAYEMARQLRAVGEVVAFVGMIDTPSPLMKERGAVARGWIHLRRWLQKGPTYPWRLIRNKVIKKLRARRTERANQGGSLPVELRGALMQRSFDAAFFRYKVEPYDGKVWLFRATGESRTRFVRDRTLGWDGAPREGVETIDCPGDHFSMCAEPHIQVLCRRLRRGLDAAIGMVNGVATSGESRACQGRADQGGY